VADQFAGNELERRSEAQEALNNALPGERKALQFDEVIDTVLGEVAEWLKALPC
jgi:hypothetical protein